MLVEDKEEYQWGVPKACTGSSNRGSPDPGKTEPFAHRLHHDQILVALLESVGRGRDTRKHPSIPLTLAANRCQTSPDVPHNLAALGSSVKSM